MRSARLLPALALIFVAGCARETAPTAAEAPTAAVPEPAPVAAEVTPVAETGPTATGPLARVKLPPGFKIHYYASDVPNARSMVRSDSGILFVGSRDRGNVYAVLDRNGDHRAEEVITLAAGLHLPNGVALRDGDLYVAEVGRILRYDDIENHLRNVPKPQVVTDVYPEDEGHGWKYIAFGPDGKLYVPVGFPCNVCDPEDEIYGTITRIEPDGSNLEIVAHGVRNTVGFDWHPETGNLWFTDNGRDRMGDNIPPDELNRITQAGQHFGFPYLHGKNIKDPQFGAGHSPNEYQLPVQELGPHVAALGMKFYTGDMFPDEYHHQIFIAEHGSWNRSSKIGYRVMLVRLDEQGRSLGYEEFATGFKQGERDWGRPVDVLVLPDGSLLISDDKAGAIYRVVYDGGGAGA